MAGKEAVNETDLEANKKPETKTDKPGADHKRAVESREAIARKRKRQSQGCGDQHHSKDCAYAEDEQVEDRPRGLANGAENEQRDSRGASKTVDNADKERAEGMEKTEAVDWRAQPVGRG